MPIYQQRGRIPRKRHVAFRGEDGRLYTEELIGNHGFSGPASLVYHLHEPTQVKGVRVLRALDWKPEPARVLRHRHFRASKMSTGPSMVFDRVPLLFNSDVALEIAHPTQQDEVFYRNAQGDEIVYVSDGAGELSSAFGRLRFSSGDYLVIPRGIAHRYRFEPGPTRCLVIESAGAVRTPKRYRNEHGQLLEHSPYSERDIRTPEWVEPVEERGDFPVVVKKDNQFVELTVAWHPFDAVGWDGYYYPWAFSIHDFEPRVGRVHLPPPVHQTFEGDGFVVCSFCPRPYDFHPEAVPAPYNHSNVMSDEVLYYASSEFMSRKGIEYGSVTLHPDGLPHGPQPGRAEASIGQSKTNELAVMVDTFRPLMVSAEALRVEDADYYRSWLHE
jgi:homogentisate 1,2-dioxygenase